MPLSERIIPPRDGSGGGTPYLRKLSPARLLLAQTFPSRVLKKSAAVVLG